MVEILGKQDEIRLGTRQLRAAAHGDRNLRLRQDRRIVDPVADHRHNRAASLQGADALVLALRRDPRADIGDAQRRRHAPRHRWRITSQQDDLLAGRLQRIDQRRASGRTSSPSRNSPRQPLASPRTTTVSPLSSHAEAVSGKPPAASARA